MNFVEMMKEKDAYTANGAVTNSTSHNFNLDLFFIAGACRNESEQNIINLLVKSYDYDRLTTLKIIFWAGDIRQGAGERRFFKLALKWLSENHPEDIQNNLDLIPEFSRWDVIFELAMTNEILFSYILTKLSDKEGSGYGLLCKWLPRKVNAVDKKKIVKTTKNTQTTTIQRKKRLLYGGIAGKIINRLGLTPKQYRQLVVAGSKTVEQQMCAKKWNEINYSQVPSVAMNKYNKAWYRNDKERFEKYIADVKSGKSKINASVIFPHDIIKHGLDNKRLNEAQITQWNNLPNYLGGTINSIIPVCDVSGSMGCAMKGLPLQISVALGLYISERNFGPFKDAFITFSESPQLQYLKGNINERIRQLEDADWGNNTNLVGVFELILRKAIDTNAPQEIMPKTILVISDMEFDSCAKLTNYETIKQAYKVSGYECPNIVFWNVNGRTNNVPITVNDQGVALISGASPSIIKSVLYNEIDPITIMNKTLDTERYSIIK